MGHPSMAAGRARHLGSPVYPSACLDAGAAGRPRTHPALPWRRGSGPCRRDPVRRTRRVPGRRRRAGRSREVPVAPFDRSVGRVATVRRAEPSGAQIGDNRYLAPPGTIDARPRSSGPITRTIICRPSGRLLSPRTKLPHRRAMEFRGQAGSLNALEPCWWLAPPSKLPAFQRHLPKALGSGDIRRGTRCSWTS
jgi:hypothetical protein